MNSGAREAASSQRGTQKSSKFVIEHIHVIHGISKSKVCGDKVKLIRILPSQRHDAAFRNLTVFVEGCNAKSARMDPVERKKTPEGGCRKLVRLR